MSRMPPLMATPLPALLNADSMMNRPESVLVNWLLFVIETAEPSVWMVPEPAAVKAPPLTIEALFLSVRSFVAEL